MKTESDLFDLATHAVGDLTGLTFEGTASKPAQRKAVGFDGVVQITFHKHKIHQPYVVKGSLNPATVHLLGILKRENPDGLLVATSHVNARQGDVLRAEGVHFMDTAGNVFLTAPGLYLLVTGRCVTQGRTHSDRSRAFHPSGLRLLFSLLSDPNLDRKSPGDALVSKTYRDISAVTGISHSTVGWIMADLIQQGMVIRTGDASRVLVGRSRILERWVQGYVDRLRPRLVVARFRPARNDWWRNAHLENGLWSGEVAAALLTGSLKPGTFTVFGDRPSNTFVLEHDLQKDAKGTVEFLEPIWRPPAQGAPQKNCAHALLVYADLMSIDDDRTRAAARIIYDRHLRTIIETA